MDTNLGLNFLDSYWLWNKRKLIKEVLNLFNCYHEGALLSIYLLFFSEPLPVNAYYIGLPYDESGSQLIVRVIAAK